MCPEFTCTSTHEQHFEPCLSKPDAKAWLTSPPPLNIFSLYGLTSRATRLRRLPRELNSRTRSVIARTGGVIDRATWACRKFVRWPFRGRSRLFSARTKDRDATEFCPFNCVLRATHEKPLWLIARRRRWSCKFRRERTKRRKDARAGQGVGSTTAERCPTGAGKWLDPEKNLSLSVPQQSPIGEVRYKLRNSSDCVFG